ncbi:hypothetical protein [Fuchsiella alkaliacetigena]|uniref:hypothetical protein n=1 Tax=Fuchsiella alkaliacetigena TaxID=957042 RepID=UPI00200AB68B|nr:hypothetical protein [Fuchsiella alkaliacetigena]MCK8825872.1 hypothetical protein [Fuchsiella alkaliacetigena]
MISNFAKNINKLKEKAVKERDLEIAEKLLNMGLEVEKVVEATDLDKDKIEEIKKETQH